VRIEINRGRRDIRNRNNDRPRASLSQKETLFNFSSPQRMEKKKEKTISLSIYNARRGHPLNPQVSRSVYRVAKTYRMPEVPGHFSQKSH